MMVFTHVAAGLTLAAAVTALAPDLAVPAAAGAAVGGVVPDLDLFAGTHRRTLHFPDLYWLPAAGFGALALARPSPLLVGAALAATTAAVHSVSDWFGAGDELRPWQRTSSRAVYVHLVGRWLAPRYWVRYDGAPEDVLLTVVLSVPALVVYDPPVRTLVLGMLVLAVAYAAVRKRVPDLGERFLS
jgi:hypothetical protein